jgi:hypothetical protein
MAIDQSGQFLGIKRGIIVKRLGAISILLLSTGPVMAADMAVKARPLVAPVPYVNDILKANNQISLDAVGTNIDYAESYPDHVQPGVFDQEKGWVPGLSVTGSWMGDLNGIHNLYAMGRGTWINGHTDYWASNGLTNSDGASVWDADFRLGKGFDIGTNSMLTPYIGAGGHWWSRNLVGPGGYHEDYSHGYAGAGLMFQVAPVSRLVLSVNGLVGSTFNSSMSTSNNGGAPINPYTYGLGNSVMYMAGISADYAFTEHLHGNIGFDYMHFAYGQSAPSPIDASLEPDSRTDYYTVRAGLGYSFYAGPVVAKY